jgi:hypothetical protein
MSVTKFGLVADIIYLGGANDFSTRPSHFSWPIRLKLDITVSPSNVVWRLWVPWKAMHWKRCLAQRLKWLSISTLQIYWPVWPQVGIRSLAIMLLRICLFCENRVWKGHNCYGPKWKYIHACALIPYDISKINNSWVTSVHCARVHHLEAS